MPRVVLGQGQRWTGRSRCGRLHGPAVQRGRRPSLRTPPRRSPRRPRRPSSPTRARSPQTAQVGTITGGATGITAAVTNNAVDRSAHHLHGDDRAGRSQRDVHDPGDRRLVVTVNQIFSWSLSFTGTTGGTQSGPAGAPASIVDLVTTTQVLTSPAAGGATTPATAVITGTATNTTIAGWTYSVDGGTFTGTPPTGAGAGGQRRHHHWRDDDGQDHRGASDGCQRCHRHHDRRQGLRRRDGWHGCTRWHGSRRCGRLHGAADQ